MINHQPTQLGNRSSQQAEIATKATLLRIPTLLGILQGNHKTSAGKQHRHNPPYHKSTGELSEDEKENW